MLGAFQVCQLVEQRLRLLHIARVKPFSDRVSRWGHSRHFALQKSRSHFAREASAKMSNVKRGIFFPSL